MFRTLKPARLLISFALVATMMVPAAAFAKSDATIIVTEYRLETGEDYTKMIGDVEVPVVELTLIGKVKPVDQNIEARWTVRDAEPYLKTLSACAGGRLSAVVRADIDPGDKQLKGKGELEFLKCRKILR